MERLSQNKAKSDNHFRRLLGDLTLIHLIMPYYGYRHDCYLLLNSLSRTSRKILKESYLWFFKVSGIPVMLIKINSWEYNQRFLTNVLSFGMAPVLFALDVDLDKISVYRDFIKFWKKFFAILDTLKKSIAERTKLKNSINGNTQGDIDSKREYETECTIIEDQLKYMKLTVKQIHIASAVSEKAILPAHVKLLNRIYVENYSDVTKSITNRIELAADVDITLYKKIVIYFDWYSSYTMKKLNKEKCLEWDFEFKDDHKKFRKELVEVFDRIRKISIVSLDTLNKILTLDLPYNPHLEIKYTLNDSDDRLTKKLPSKIKVKPHCMSFIGDKIDIVYILSTLNDIKNLKFIDSRATKCCKMLFENVELQIFNINYPEGIFINWELFGWAMLNDRILKYHCENNQDFFVINEFEELSFMNFNLIKEKDLSSCNKKNLWLSRDTTLIIPCKNLKKVTLNDILSEIYKRNLGSKECEQDKEESEQDEEESEEEDDINTLDGDEQELAKVDVEEMKYTSDKKSIVMSDDGVLKECDVEISNYDDLCCVAEKINIWKINVTSIKISGILMYTIDNLISILNNEHWQSSILSIELRMINYQFAIFILQYCLKLKNIKSICLVTGNNTDKSKTNNEIDIRKIEKSILMKLKSCGVSVHIGKN